MKNRRHDVDPKAYNPTFQWRFLSFKHWGTWIMILLAMPVALLPNKIRCKLATRISNYMVDKQNKASQRAWVNLTLCFPMQSRAEKINIIKKSFTTAGTYLLGFASLTLRSKHWLEKNSEVTGLENLTAHTDNNENVILLVPHTWAVDAPAILLASKGLPVVSFVKKQKNEILDWLMHRQRVQYGGHLYERSQGIKPFIRTVKKGYLGYYLPDQDHGAESSVFVDFFATIKATLPSVGKIAKISNAKVIPVFSAYNSETGKYEIDIHPAIENFPTGNDEGDARAINAFIESVITNRPEQYMWNLQLLRTQQDESNPYKNENLHISNIEKRQSS